MFENCISIESKNHPSLNRVIPIGKRIPIVVGESITIRCLIPNTIPSFTLLRSPVREPKKPAGLSDETWAASRGARFDIHGPQLSIPCAGLYLVDVNLGGFHRTIEFVGLPKKFLDEIAPPHAQVDRRHVAFEVLNDSRCTQSTIVASLEGDAPRFGLGGELHGNDSAKGAGISLKNFGAAA